MEHLTAFQKAVLNLLVVIVLYQIAVLCFMFSWQTLGIIAAVAGTVVLLIRVVYWILEYKFGPRDYQ